MRPFRERMTKMSDNTEKAGVNTVAGAAVEVGSFVKLSK